jgi:hypothetical protein
MVSCRYSWTLLALCGLLAGCARGSSEVRRPGADIVVSGTTPSAAIASGASAAFSIEVVNSGADAATDVRIDHKIGDQSRLESMRCRASGGAVCPQLDGARITVKRLPAGGALRFTDTLRRASNTPGFIIDAMTVSAANDSDPGHDTVALAVEVH